MQVVVEMWQACGGDAEQNGTERESLWQIETICLKHSGRSAFIQRADLMHRRPRLLKGKESSTPRPEESTRKPEFNVMQVVGFYSFKCSPNGVRERLSPEQTEIPN